MDALAFVLTTALICVELILLVPLGYLVVLSIAAPGADRQRSLPHADAPPCLSFAILIPAKDEATGIAHAVRSALAVDYPPDRFTVFVVADNCVDETAAQAREAGATVYERFDERQHAKGYALRWLLERLHADGRLFDAYVVVDADSRLSTNFLTEMAGAIAAGAQVAQARYRVLNGDATWMAGLRAVAFALFNHLRPLGRMRLGWSAGLKGNGMCFRREVFERFGWGSYSLAEDVEYHLLLVDGGIHVRYVPAAVVEAEMPTSLRQARSQQDRWERGRLDIARGRLGPLLRGFLRDGDLARIDAALEVMLPPLSLMLGAVLLALLAAIALRSTSGGVLGILLLLLLSIHIVTGAALARLTPRAYLSLLRAPLYVVWKCWVYLVALVERTSKPWVRTERGR